MDVSIWHHNDAIGVQCMKLQYECTVDKIEKSIEIPLLLINTKVALEMDSALKQVSH